LQALLAKHPEQAAKLVLERSSHVAVSLLPVTAKAVSVVSCDDGRASKKLAGKKQYNYQ
jgi:hypothetical protein